MYWFVWDFMNCTLHMIIILQLQIYHVVCVIQTANEFTLLAVVYSKPYHVYCLEQLNLLYATQIEIKSHQIRGSFHVGCLPTRF